MSLPEPGTYPVYFDNYIKMVDAASVKAAIEKYASQMNNFFTNIKAEKADYRYEENKWSIKVVLQHLIDQLGAGKKMALLTDAGTPGISDPAFLLVRECIKNNIKVECLPGATAFVPALVNSGLPINRFVFDGFLPQKKGRQTLFKKLAEEERTMIFYESPMRLVKTLDDCILYFGAERQCCVSRELTKIFEENKRGTLREVCDHFKQKTVKGEIVIVIQGKE